MQAHQRQLLDKMLSKVGDLYFRRRIEMVLDFANVRDGDTILDAGCGEGFYELVISKLYNVKITGIDSDPKILAAAKKQVVGLPNVRLHQADLCHLDFKDNTFDTIICSEVLEHIDRDDKALQELYRVLKKGGTLVVTVPNSNYPLFSDPLNKVREWLGLGHFRSTNRLLGGVWSYDHKRLYGPAELGQLMSDAGFTVKDTKMLSRYSSPFYILLLNLGKQLYTQLPVGQDVKSAMEKFDWDEPQPAKRGVAAGVLQGALTVLRAIDGLNDREFSQETPTLGIAVKAMK